MNVLVVGAGGREHAIVDALAQSPKVRKIYAAPGNGGMREQAELVPISPASSPELVEFAQNKHIDLTFIGPEIPLRNGVVDAFSQRGRIAIGPTADLARLESSKSFAKHFCQTNHIPTADFRDCATPAEANAVLEKCAYPVVIKADGLAAGKGVVIAENQDRARLAVHEFMVAKTLGEAGSKLVIEEFLDGDEASFHVFADGPVFQPMVAAQDHKRRFDGDTGPNTGGMGAYSTDTILSSEQYGAVLNRIVRPTPASAGS